MCHNIWCEWYPFQREIKCTCIFILLDPILPDMLRQISLYPDRLTLHEYFAKPHPLPANGTESMQTKQSIEIAILVSMKPLLETLFNIAAGFLIDR